MEIKNLYDFLEQEVIDAYYTVLETLEHYDVAPPLVEIYDEFYMTVLSNIEEAYERVFGEGSKINDEWLVDLGIDLKGIPNILVVCKILNLFKLGYTWNNVLYNIMPQPLLPNEEVIYDW